MIATGIGAKLTTLEGVSGTIGVLDAATAVAVLTIIIVIGVADPRARGFFCDALRKVEGQAVAGAAQGTAGITLEAFAGIGTTQVRTIAHLAWLGDAVTTNAGDHLVYANAVVVGVDTATA